ncbi:hypothetical protein [Brachybacterium sp. NPDC056505]|uniref:hypothetical protein n=1 Tax=Brachybacterium sp. NPDC056505 TaxID=3345843 RepID=UPI00366B9924
MTMHPDLKRALVTGAALAAAILVFLMGTGTGYGTATYLTPDPSSCLEALDRADQVMDLVDDRNQAIADGIDAYEDLDADGIDHATHQIADIDEQIGALGYPDARDECRTEMDR